MNIYQRHTIVKSNETILRGRRVTSHIYQTLIGYAHQQKITCFPAVNDIAALAAVEERCVRKHLRILEKLKLIAITPRTMPNGRTTSNLYTLLGLKEAQEELVNTCKAEQADHPIEALLLTEKNKNTYGGFSEDFGDRNPPKEGICNLEHSNQQIQNQRTKTIASPDVAKREETIASPDVAKREKTIASKGSIRFEGELTTEKSVEIYNVFRRYGFIKHSTNEFFTFIANCSMVKRLNNSKKVRNVFSYLVWVYKSKMSRKLITMKDEDVAREQITLIRDLGRWPEFGAGKVENQQSIQLPEPEIAREPNRSSSRPPIDWPVKNLPEVNRETALATKVRRKQITHIHPDWLIKNMSCWVARAKSTDGETFYNPPKFTDDGWIEITGDTVVVPLIDSNNRRISQEEFSNQLMTGGFKAPDRNSPAT